VLTSAVANKPLTPWRSSAGVLGMQRTIGWAPSQLFMLAQVMPAAMDTTSWFGFRLGRKAWQTAFIAWGLTASTITSTP